MRRIFIILIVLFTVTTKIYSQDSEGNEMRAVWIATTKNIDFPTNKYATTDEQKKEFIKMMDLFKKIGINAVMVQIRPAADAFYPSKYEPWSEWLTGKQGKAPNPYYDPMDFMIKECKKRNIEFHAWFNPFRAVANIETADIYPNHITKRKPNWFFTYDINTFFNPGIPEAREWVMKVIADVVQRYDIDGVHFDDYFYPYPVRDENNIIITIPDRETFKKYNNGKYKDIRDWRRNNMDNFIKAVSDTIKKLKPYIKFGVAPSGVWRNKGTDSRGSNTRGLAHYDYLYADVLKWLKEGWIDYVAPQLYWNIGNQYADYKTLVDWWSKNTYGKHLYIGQAPYRASSDAPAKAWRNKKELPSQMRINRKNNKVYGSIFYKASAMKINPLGFNDSLKNDFYKKWVDTPKMAWLEPKVITPVDTIKPADTTIVAQIDYTPPPPPDNLRVTKIKGWYMISWDAPKVSGIHPNDPAVSYNVYKFKGFDAEFVTEDELFENTKNTYLLVKRKWYKLFKKEYNFVIKALDNEENESKISEVIELKI